MRVRLTSFSWPPQACSHSGVVVRTWCQCLRFIRSWRELVAHESELAAVGRPGGHVDGPLAAEEFGQHLHPAVGQRHQAQQHIFVLRMALYVRFVRKENKPLSIRRRMSEPIVSLVLGDLFLLRAIGLHAPDLHSPGAVGVEVNELPVRRIVRPVVESLCPRQPLLDCWRTDRLNCPRKKTSRWALF